MKFFAPFALVILLSSCYQRNTTEEKALHYFDLYAERTDWEGFQDQFSEKLKFEDVIFGFKMNKEEFVAFYNWPDSLFSKHPDHPKTLILEDLATTNNTAVGRGYFTPFYYGGQLMATDDPWKFTIWLKFDEKGKIIEQTDWIEYPPQFLQQAAERLMEDD